MLKDKISETCTDHCETAIQILLEELCPEDEEAVSNTPDRWVRAMKELTSGYTADPKLTIFPATNNNMVIKRRIKYYSLCRHHLLPFYGHCYISYIPNEWIIGLSKLARIVDIYSHRLQLQEDLTYEIAKKIMGVLETKDVMVVLTGMHLCEQSRGIENDEEDSHMITSHVSGVFKDHEVRMESLKLMNISD